MSEAVRLKFQLGLRSRSLDWGIALLLCVGYVALLLSSVSDLGYARDEGFYFQASKSYAKWFELFFADPSRAIGQAEVDRYWRANNEHPALIKSLFALSYQFLFVKWRWFSEEGTAFRFPAMVLSGLALSLVYLWGRRIFGFNFSGRLSALTAALLLGAMPRLFYHSHLDCFDMPVLTMWLLTTYAYWRASQSERLSSAILAGVLYGLLLNTKHNSWLLPFALAPHLLLLGQLRFWRRPLEGRRGALKALLCMATIGPALFYLGWPWIWRDTLPRLQAYAMFHLRHDYYNMEFLGYTYWQPPMPLSYAPVMTLATVPTITLLLFATGAAFVGWQPLRRALKFLLRRNGQGAAAPSAEIERAVALRGAVGAAERREASGGELGGASPSRIQVISHVEKLRRVLSSRDNLVTFALWAFCILMSYAPWLNKNTPIFGGTKHWIQAYPFMCLFAGVGVLLTLGAWERLSRGGVWRPRLVKLGVVVALVCAPVLSTAQSHPWGLSAYVPLVGGASGAASLGLNRTFWGYTTGSAADFINQTAPRGARVYIHDTAYASWQMMLSDGRLRKDLRAVGRPHESDIAIYHHEPHMSRVEYQIWVAYGTTQPAWVGAYAGVPVVWVYARPR